MFEEVIKILENKLEDIQIKINSSQHGFVGLSVREKFCKIKEELEQAIKLLKESEEK